MTNKGSLAKYVVRLSADERSCLAAKIRTGLDAACRLLKARILLKADVSLGNGGWDDGRIAAALDTSASTVLRTRRQFVKEGLEAALARKKRQTPPAPRILDGEAGRDRVIPPKADAAFVAAMEDVMEVHIRPHDPARPQVCRDETSKQRSTVTRTPIPMGRGHEARSDCEYEHAGVASLFLLFAPLEGWRHVAVRERRTAIDHAHVLRDLADTHVPRAERIILVQDNLNTHSPASLYETFPPAEVRRRTVRVAPNPETRILASWLNIAECELSTLARQCLHRRIPDRGRLEEQTRAWTKHAAIKAAQPSTGAWQLTMRA